MMFFLFSVTLTLTQCADPRLAAIEPPSALPDSGTTEAFGRLEHYNRRVFLGVGHLRPPDDSHYWDWLEHAVLPVFDAPGGEIREWLARGWRVDPTTGERREFAGDGMVETGYEARSFIVLERHDDGWMRILLDDPDTPNADGWTHDCLNAFGRDSLSFESWPERFSSDDISPLYFRTQVPHALRASPSTTAERLHVIPARESDYEIEWLEVRDDWARVRVTQPSDYCLGPDEIETRTYEGWIKWWDEEIGPWLWYYTRGC